MSRKGVTLVEVLIVVAVIAVVAAIILPVIARSRDRAVVVNDISNLRQIGMAAEMYQSDFGKWPDGLAPLIGPDYINDDRILRSPHDTYKEGASRRLSRLLGFPERELDPSLPPVTYVSYKEAGIMLWYYDENLRSQNMSGWLINPVKFKLDAERGPYLVGSFERLLWDGSVQVRHIETVRGINSDGYEFAIEPTYSLFCDPDEEAYNNWYSGDFGSTSR